MTAPRPTFRVMKNGYDRFAVDDAIERYAAQVDQLQKQLDACRTQLDETQKRLRQVEQQYNAMVSSAQAQKEAADNIARLSLREANQIISTAQKNADDIVRESLQTARLILTDLSKLYGGAEEVKDTTKENLEKVIKDLDTFELPRMPDLRWLEEAEKKLR